MTKKKIITLIVFLSLDVFSVAAQDQTKLQQASRKLAAISASQGVIEGMNSYDFPDLVEDTKKLILTDTKLHSERIRSEQNVRNFHDSKFDSVLNNNLKEILKRLDFNFPENEFRELIYGKHQSKIAVNKKKFLNEKGGTAFKLGRALAVNVQQNNISMNSYPDIKIVEDLQTLGWPKDQVKERKRIHKIKMARDVTATGEVLLEEVSRNLDQNLDKIFSNARIQIDNQFEQLEKEPGPTLITSKQLTAFWKQKIREKIELMMANKKKGQMIYPEIFSSVNSKIKILSNQSELNRFQAFIKNTNLKIADSERIIKIIEKNLAKHKIYNNSKNIIADSFFEEVKNRIITNYANLAPETQKSDFKNRLIGMHLNTVKRNIVDKISVLITPDFEKSRNIIAERQIKKHFTVLFNGILEFTGKHEVIIKGIMGVDSKKKIDIVTFSDCLKPPMINVLTKETIKTDKLLSETENQVVERLAKIIQEAKRAWKGQDEIYFAYEGYILSASKKKLYIKNIIKEKTYNKTNPGNLAQEKLSKCIDNIQGSIQNKKDALVNCFIAEIDSIWEKNRKTIIWGNETPSLSTKYLNLFEYMKNKIAQNLMTDIGKVFDDLEREAERIRKAEEQAAIAEAKRKAEEQAAIAEAKRKAEEQAAIAEAKGKAEEKVLPINLNIRFTIIPWWWLLLIIISFLLLLLGGYLYTSRGKSKGSIKKEITGSSNFVKWVIVLLVVLNIIFVAIILSINSQHEIGLIQLHHKEGNTSVYKWGNLELLIDESDPAAPGPRNIQIREAK